MGALFECQLSIPLHRETYQQGEAQRKAGCAQGLFTPPAGKKRTKEEVLTMQ
jgi:hypothetical protein